MAITNPTDAAPPRFDRFRTMLRGLRLSGMCVLYQDRDLKVLMIENAPDFWPSHSDIMARGDAAIFDEKTAARLAELKQSVLEGGGITRLETVVMQGGDPRWFDITIEPDEDSSGSVRGLFVTAVEITELKHREQVLRALLREVSHRSKNMLAIVQSIAMQTARYSGTLDGFLVKFRGRIQSLSQSQDLITESNWHGARYSQLVHAQLSRYVGLNERRVTVSGSDCYLSPNAALHVGLALHELIVNSAVFGAIAVGGTIAIDLGASASGDDILTMVWDEKLEVSIAGEVTKGRFGSAVLERVVPSALASRASYEMNERSIRYEIDIPNEQCAPSEGSKK